MAYPATGKLTSAPSRDDGEPHLFLKLFALFAGIAVGAMMLWFVVLVLGGAVLDWG